MTINKDNPRLVVSAHRTPLLYVNGDTIDCYTCNREGFAVLYELWFDTEQAFLCPDCLNDLRKIINAMISEQT